MSSSTPLLIESAASGAALYGLFWLWKKGASRWSTWFPALKKGLEWSLLLLALGWVFWLVSLLTAPGTDTALLALGLVAGLAVPGLLTWRKAPDKEETKRGSTLASSKKVAQMVKATRKPADLVLGGVPLPFDAEPYHFLVAGSTGTGKSVAISTLLEALQKRNDTVILVDSGGGFLNKYFREGVDFVFNPFDDRCVGWSPTAEMAGAWDAQALARSIVPDGTGDAKEWNNYAQTFVSSVLRRLWEKQQLTLKDFLYYIQAAPLKELKVLLEGTPAASQLEAERTFGSIRTIAGNYIGSYDSLPSTSDPFSVAEMIRAEHSGTLFVTYRDDQLDSLRSLIGCLLDVAARTILSLEPNPNRRVWLIIDEFASIGKVQSIEAVATKARKAGGCLVLGLQSVSQLKDRYGDNGAQTILSCLSTWLVLRCSDADTADYMSKYIGEAEVQRTQRNTSSSDTGGTEGWSEQSSTQRVVLASEIQAFANLTGLLKLAGDYPVCDVKLGFPPKRGEAAASFVVRDYAKRPLLKIVPPAPEPKAPAQEDAPAPRAPSKTTPAVPPVQSAPVVLSQKGLRAQLQVSPAGRNPEQKPEDLLPPEVAVAEGLLDTPDSFELPSSKQRRGVSLQRPAPSTDTPASVSPAKAAASPAGLTAGTPSNAPRVVARRPAAPALKVAPLAPPPAAPAANPAMNDIPASSPATEPAEASAPKSASGETATSPVSKPPSKKVRSKNKDLLGLLR